MNLLRFNYIKLFYTFIFSVLIIFKSTTYCAVASTFDRCFQIWMENPEEFHSFDENSGPLKSQSASFLELEPIEKINAALPFTIEYSDWLHDIVDLEEGHKDNYYAVYHACSGLSLFQDLLKMTIEAKLNIILPDDFIFMRMPWKESYEIADVEDYFAKYDLPLIPWPSFETQMHCVKIYLELLDIELQTLSIPDEDILFIFNNFRTIWFHIENPGILDERLPSEQITRLLNTITWQGTWKDFLNAFKSNIGIFDTSITIDIGDHRAALRKELMRIENELTEKIVNLSRQWQENLLCVNLTLFGNYGGGDCSLDYWHGMYNSVPKNANNLILEILEMFGLKEDSLKELEEIYDLIREKDSVIYSIFIPKHLTDKIMYLSYGFYIPVDYAGMLPSEVLKTYQTDMQSIEAYKKLQCRLVFSQRYLLNPFSGVKYFRNHTIDPEKYLQYRSRLEEWGKTNFQDHLE